MAKPVEHCPECGAEFPAGKLACPNCGSDQNTGWKSAEEIDYQSIEIPDAWPPEPEPARRVSWTWIAALMALLGMLALLFAF